MDCKHSILVLAQGEETVGKFNQKMTRDHNDCCEFKTSHFESFQEGSRVDKFDIVIIWAPESDEGEIEMSEEFYKHYSIAPVTAWYTGVSQDWIKEQFKSDFIFQAPGEDNKADLKELIKTCTDKYHKILEDDVKPAF
jgi:hypothetical protein